MESGQGKFVDTTYADREGRREYLQILQEAERKGECPFCPANIGKHGGIRIGFGNWTAIKNRWPYPNADVHYLLVPNRHITEIEDVGKGDWRDIKKLVLAVRARPAPRAGGALVVRFGTNSGATVRHLHFHLIAPATDPSTGKSYPGKHVNFPIG